MEQKFSDKLTILSLFLALLVATIQLFIEIKEQLQPAEEPPSTKKLELDIKELQNEILLLKLESSRRLLII